MGTVFKPRYSPKGMTYAEAKGNGLLVESPSWWIKYRDHTGKPVKERIGPSEKEARRRLKLREGAVAEGKPVSVKADKVLVRELAEDVTNDYKANGRRSLDRLEDSLTHVLAFFGHRRAAHVSTADVTAYVTQRQEKGAANATINRELAALKRAYRLAAKSEKVYRVPHIPMLEENNVRQGFFERDQFEAVRKLLPDYAKPVATFMYVTGWRSKSEVLPLTWKQVDFKAGTVRLEPGTTKNNDARTFYMTPELRGCLEARREITEAAQKQTGQIIPRVFHRDGVPLRDFRKSWRTACKTAGLPGRILHDFRRTAVRNLERAGVSRSVAMKMTGHKTESVYRRYAIVADSDLREAAHKLHMAGH